METQKSGNVLVGEVHRDKNLCQRKKQEKSSRSDTCRSFARESIVFIANHFYFTAFIYISYITVVCSDNVACNRSRARQD